MSGKPRSARSAKILVVEDEQVVAMDMEMQLTGFGYDVTGIAASGKEALFLTEKTEPDLILMDIRLRGPLDGFAIAAEVQRLWHLPVVFISAFGNGEAQRRAKTISPYGFLTKPYRPEDLRDVVSAALELHRSPESSSREA